MEKIACEICKTQFKPVSYRQRFCCKGCRDKDKSENYLKNWAKKDENKDKNSASKGQASKKWSQNAFF